ncbi:AraC family transcriptional regulator [Clavibacter michiganensis]|uniref:AraC family transcriptional regulator n=1 Tax=Clavibacter michiganensis TaxID=28447 RepID=UPI0005B8FCC2|nr:AraC family transcriptional regulator [Clavibacter michiganensis]
MGDQRDVASSQRLDRVLHALRMTGTFYCRAELRDPWALEMPAKGDSVSFHVLTRGSCWLRLPGAEAVELRPGDLALVPHGIGHHLRSAPGPARGARVDLLPQRYLNDRSSVLEHGGDGTATQLICGIVAFEGPAARRLMRALPELLRIDEGDAAAGASVHATLRLMADELSTVQVGGDAVATRLADVLVVQAVRAWLQRDEATADGWIHALRDERIGRVLEAVHARPGDGWDLDRLARTAVMSRSSFSARFAELVGESPGSYVTRWRMDVARHRLATEDVPASQLAGELGYRSEAAFHRAFVRMVGATPGSVRRV